MDLKDSIGAIKDLATDAAKTAAVGRIFTDVGGAVFALERSAEGGEEFTQLIAQPEPQPAATALSSSTLQSIVDYLKENRDALHLEGIAVQIVSPELVRVLGPLRENRDREVFLSVTPAQGDDLAAFLGKGWSQEDFVLKAQLLFTKSEERDALLAVVGNLTDEAVRVAIDDGVTQQVSTRQGTKAGGATVKSPVLLTPLRSFTEIALAPVPFVVRVNNKGPGMPSTVALHDAGGGAWRVDAITKIAAWLAGAAGADRKFGLIA